MTVGRLGYDALPASLHELFRLRYERLGYLGEFFQVAAHQPDALAGFVAFTEELKDALPANLTQLIALTVSCETGNLYERNQHERLSVKLGLALDWVADVERLAPTRAPVLDAGERAIQALVLAMVRTIGRDATNELDTVEASFPEPVVVGVLLTVLRYLGHAAVANTLGLQPPVGRPAGLREAAAATPSLAKRVFDPAEMAFLDVQKLMTGLIVPRPIAWVGTQSADGVANLAPFSYFNAVCNHPPMIAISMTIRNGRPKDSLANIMATGAFTLNLVSRDLAEQMNASAAEVGPDVDEFELAGLTKVAGGRVDAPRVGESRWSAECILDRVVMLGEEPRQSGLVLGEIVRFHIEERLLDGTRIDQDGLDAVARMGGPTYSDTRRRFDLVRPTAAASPLAPSALAPSTTP